MAYQTRQRDPLLDSSMQEALEKRGRELLGFCLLLVGVAVGAMLVSYSPNDPNWMVATDAVPQNLLGRFGASVSAVLMMIVGLASYVLALAFMGWGLRFMLHQGFERAIGRLTPLPIAIACAALFLAALPQSQDSAQGFGMGGLFGDTIAAALVNILPLQAAVKLPLLAGISGMAAFASLLFILGVTRAEGRFALRLSLIAIYYISAFASGLVGRAGRGAGRVGQAAYQSAARGAQGTLTRATHHAAPLAPLYEDEDPEIPPATRGAPMLRGARPSAPAQEAIPAPAIKPEQPSLFERIPVMRALLGQEDSAPAAPAAVIEPPAPENAVSSRISDAIRKRLGGATRPAGLHISTHSAPAIAAGPKLTARATAPVAGLSGEIFRPATPPLTRDPAKSAPLRRGAALTSDNIFADDDDSDLDLPFADPFASDEIEAEGGFSTSPEDADYTAPQGMKTRSPTSPRVMHDSARKATPSRRAMADAQPSLPLEPKREAHEFPPLALLTSPTTIERHHLSDEALEENARMLESVLDDYGVKGDIVSVRPGPVVTMYELEPAPGLKASRVIGLADDIARSMSALSTRVSTVPGRSVIGIELPNVHREKVVLREILASREFGDGSHRLPLALGKDIGGAPVVANLAKMPHLLIAGTTGSGKSVAINTMILSLLYKLRPDECRMIMIDPKMLELSVYDGIPHLLSPVVTDPKKAVVALKWVVGEMEERYRKMSKMGVRNIEGYNGRVREALAKGEMFKRTVQTGFDDLTGEPVFETEEFRPEVMPFIVVIVDEMADLMMVAGKEIEACIQRLAQMARASGIHLIMATQRPSVDVITGTIKANFPTRISFHVTSKIDSRTILGEMGAEQLLGQGDMLYMAGGAKITRVHGPFVSDEEVEEIVRHLKSFGPPDYSSTVLDGPDEDRESDIDLVLGLGGGGDSDDALYDQAVQVVLKDRKCSTSYIQRKLGIGYNKAARLVEQMEESGLVTAANHVGKREILVPEA